MLAEIEQKIPTPGEVANRPHLFAETFLKIQDKKRKTIPLRFNHAQRHYIKNRTKRDLVLKARQLGLSTVIQAELFRLAITRPVATATLAHLSDATQRLRRMTQFFYNNLPVQPDRALANAIVTTYPTLGSIQEIATAGSKGSAGRGGTFTHIHGSEAAWWPDAEAIVAGMLQAGNPSIVLESTPNGAQGLFYELSMAAHHDPKNSPWNLIFIPWWFDPEYAIALDEGETLDYSTEESSLVEREGLSPEQIKWRREKQRILKDLFIQEYPEDPLTCFLVSGTSYFNINAATWMAPTGATPQDGHLYYGGIDWGQKQDFTVVSIIDETTGCQVELARFNGLRMKELRREAIKVLEPWNPQLTLVELNAMGQQQFEEMEEETDLKLAGFTMGPTNKGPVIRAHRISLEDQGLKLLPIDYQQHEYRSFQASQTAHGHWKYEAASGAHDDTVIATALADHARKIAPPMGAWGSA